MEAPPHGNWDRTGTTMSAGRFRPNPLNARRLRRARVPVVWGLTLLECELARSVRSTLAACNKATFSHREGPISVTGSWRPDMTDAAWAETLPALLGEVWRRIEAGEGAARHPVLATTGDGGPEVRTLVLRAADRSDGTLEMHTDAASPKVAQLRRRPRAAILIWDEDAALQTRLHARVSIRSGASAATVWGKVPADVRQRYGGTVPGKQIDTPEGAETAGDLARFAVLRAHVYRIDVLHLGHPRRRALYSFDDGFAGRWIAP